MARDEFTKAIQDVLAKRVGVRCSNPSCEKLTTGPRTESQHIVNIGVAAHITAASTGGPRFDPRLTPEQRQSADNGIWLCQNCAKLVDNDTSRYKVETLRTWKSRAEESALAEIEGRPIAQPADLSAELTLTYSPQRIESKLHDYKLEVRLTNLGTEPFGPYHIDVEIPARIVPSKQCLFVPERSTREVAFFRVSNKHHPEEIYPGDTKLVMSVDYFMDIDIFIHRGDLFDRPVKVTLYRPSVRPVTLERSFGEFQVF